MMLVDTEAAVHWLMHWGPPWVGRTEQKGQCRNRIYKWQAEGLLVNHGKTGKGQARWDLKALEALVCGG